MELKINSELKQQISDIEFVAGGTVNQLQPLSAYTWNIGTDNTTDTWVPVLKNNVWEHRVIPTTYNSTAPTLSGLTVNGAATVNSITINSGFGKKYVFKKTMTLTTSWQIALNYGDLPSGAYIVHIQGIQSADSKGWQDDCRYVGIMSWYGGQTNANEESPITLHTTGHAHNGEVVYLSTFNHSHSTDLNTTLEIKYSVDWANPHTITFTFVKIV